MRLAVERALDQRESMKARTRELAAWAAENDGPTRAAELIEQLVASRGAAG
jgi:UDP:flavonoid glycosyltransferase YjiC (YdhE family)